MRDRTRPETTVERRHRSSRPAGTVRAQPTMPLNPATAVALQRAAGNAAVARLVDARAAPTDVQRARDPEGKPLTTEKAVEAAQKNLEAANEAAEIVAKASGLEKKTIAVAISGLPSMSGWTHWAVEDEEAGLLEFENSAVANESVLDYMYGLADRHGYAIKEHKLFDHGVPGRYYASHAEKQLSVVYPDEPIGVSKRMCGNCLGYFQAVANDRDEQQVVVDVRDVNVFDPQ